MEGAGLKETEYVDVIKKLPLFSGLSETELVTILRECGAHRQQIRSGQNIISLGSKVSGIGVLLSGNARVVKDDFWGNSTILAHLGQGDIFGEAFACSGCAATVDVYADSDAVVMWLPYTRLIGADAGGVISRRLAYMFAKKNVFLTNRIEHLSQRSLREKILSYLKEQAVAAGSSSFTISLDRAGMADYLAADRSALSAMLGKLKKEGIIDYHKNHFVLMGFDGNGESIGGKDIF